MRKPLLLCKLLIISYWGFTQQPLRLSFNHLTKKDGLASNYIASQLLDSHGNLWLCTSQGLSRFDGAKCITFKEISGQANQAIEGDDGNIWIGTIHGIWHYDYRTDVLSQVAELSKNWCLLFYFDKYGWLWFLDSNSRHVLAYYPKTKKVCTVSTKIIDDVWQAAPFEMRQELHYFYELKNKGFIQYQVKYNPQNQENHFSIVQEKQFFTSQTSMPQFFVGQSLYAENDSIMWVGGSNGLTKLNTKTRQFKIFNTLNNLSVHYVESIIPYKDNLLFVGSGAETGLLVFDRVSEKFIQRFTKDITSLNSLSSTKFSRILVDKDDNLFVGTRQTGLNFTNIHKSQFGEWFRAKELLERGFKDNEVPCIAEANDGKIYVGTATNGVWQLDTNGKLLKNFFPEKLGISALTADSKNRVWAATHQALYLLTPLTGSYQTLQPPKKQFNEDIFQVIQIADNQWFIMGETHIYIASETNNHIVIEQIMAYEQAVSHRNFYTLYDAASQSFFIAADWGGRLIKLKKNGSQWLITQDANSQNRINTIQNGGTQHIWLNTQSGRIELPKDFKKDESGFLIPSKIVTISPDNDIRQIFDESSGNQWLITAKGICYFDKTKHSYREFSSADGATSLDYSTMAAIRLKNGRYLFGGNAGITVVYPNSYQVKPRLHVTSIKINEEPLVMKENLNDITNITLEPDQNIFAFEVSGIDYGNPADVKILYKLEGFDNNWQEQINPAVIRYANVTAGTYDLRLKVFDESGQESSLKSYHIQINQSVVRSWWFRASLLGLLLLLAYLIFKLRINQLHEQRREAEFTKLRAQAELKALRAQINPHFIFNCLNTIDAYFLNDQKWRASKFLNKFSKLIRLTLENSENPTVSISQEIKLLELYLQLEEERFGKSFRYELNIQPELLEKTYQIPPLLLQPFVENALLHGLRHLTGGNGFLQIEMKIAENTSVGKIVNRTALYCRIEDNGIGRAAAGVINAQKNEHFKSMGMNVTMERIASLAKIYGETIKPRISDLPQGTRIELWLPLTE